MQAQNRMSSAPRRREIELDFIRGIAILMVLDFHSPGHSILFAPFIALGWKNFGWTGVDIFFVLSGFLVGGLLVKEWQISGRINAKRFLIRRGLKIWPQYYVFLFIALLVGRRTIRSEIGNLLNLQNYLGGIAHTWTLAVEEHAYLLLVAFFWVVARRKINARKVFLMLVAAACAVIVNRLIQAVLGYSTYNHTDIRIDGILYGVLLAILYHHAPARFARLQQLWPVWVAVIAATLIYLRFPPPTELESPLSWIFTDMSGVSVLLLLYRRQGTRHSVPYRVVARIGLYSYGIYLWHVSVIGPIVRIGAKMPQHAAELWLLLAPALFGIATGYFFTRLVEFPALALRDRLFPRIVDSAVGISAQVEVSQHISGPVESTSA